MSVEGLAQWDELIFSGALQLIELELLPSLRRPLRILCLGAHCDDIEIGCGGTLLRLLGRRNGAEVTWVTFSGTKERQRELRKSAADFLRQARSAAVVCHEFQDAFFPSQYSELKGVFESTRKMLNPDVVFTHESTDRHQDHRLVGELTWTAFRDSMILAYEIPKYDGGLTTPNAYVALTASQVDRKIKLLMRCYASQRTRTWFSPDTFRATLRLRGVESGSATGWAEGFHVRKFCLG